MKAYMLSCWVLSFCIFSVAHATHESSQLFDASRDGDYNAVGSILTLYSNKLERREQVSTALGVACLSYLKKNRSYPWSADNYIRTIALLMKSIGYAEGDIIWVRTDSEQEIMISVGKIFKLAANLNCFSHNK